MQLRVQQEFVSLQGTGQLVGTPQYFVRLSGCSVKACPIRRECDEPDALHKNRGENQDPKEVALRAVRQMGRGGWLHITGGEPLDQREAVEALALEAEKVGLRIHYQTSGVWPPLPRWDWVTVSPKTGLEDMKVIQGNELVLLDQGQGMDELREITRRTFFWSYFLQPIWGRSRTDTIARVHLANRCGMPWRFTDQMHKVWEVM